MGSRVAYFMVAIVILLTHNTLLRVKGQPTVQGSENEDSSIGIVAGFQQLFGETCQRQNEQVQQMHELHNASFQEMRRQLDAIMTSLQAVDLRSQEQMQDMRNLTVSFQQMKDQQDSVVTSLQEIDRRSREQMQDMRNLNVSFQQMKDQLDSVVTSIEVSDRCSVANDTSNNNRTQNEVATALETDLEERTVPPPTVNNWTILMHRFDGSLNFNRSWVEYRNGFGDMGRGEFWLGNEKIHRLTNRNGVVHTLRIEMQLSRSGQWYYADYDTFSIDSESNKYTLHLSGFSGNAGDSLTDTSETRLAFLDGMNFSTFDNDNDNNNNRCAVSYGGGWWFNNCHHACLTCKYNPAYAYFRWYSLRHLSSDGHGKLRAARMMIKSK